MALWGIGRVFLNRSLVRGLATRKRGPWNVPNMPIRTPRDFDYFRALKRKAPKKITYCRRCEREEDNPKRLPKERIRSKRKEQHWEEPTEKE